MLEITRKEKMMIASMKALPKRKGNSLITASAGATDDEPQ